MLPPLMLMRASQVNSFDMEPNGGLNGRGWSEKDPERNGVDSSCLHGSFRPIGAGMDEGGVTQPVPLCVPRYGR